MPNEIERPSCCGECRRYQRNLFEKGLGACDNWAGAKLPPDAVCHPNFGIKKDTKNKLIQWPKAKYWTAQWNPVIGCRPCSPACENCYAAAWARRFGQSFKPHDTAQKPPRSGVVFCGNMTDLFGDWLGDKPNDYVRSLINWRSDAIYLWLTKRPKNMCDAMDAVEGLTTFNHYFGITVENQEWYIERSTEFDMNLPPSFNTWLSCEPLLGPIDLRIAADKCLRRPYDWLVVGCESGPKRRPCKIEWVESIVEQCKAAKIPVFVKQLDIGGKCVTDINKFPEHLRIRQVPWAKET